MCESTKKNDNRNYKIIKNKILAHLEIWQIYTVFWCGSVSFLGIKFANKTFNDFPHTLLTFLIVLIGWIGTRYILAYLNKELDKIQHPEKPIPSHRLNSKSVLTIGFILAFIGTFLTILFLNEKNIILISLIALSVVIFNKISKSKPIFSHLVDGLLLIEFYFFVIFSSNLKLPSFEFYIWFLPIIFLVHDTSISISNAIKTIDSDKKMSYKTIPILIGVEKSYFFILFLNLLNCLFLVYLNNIFNIFTEKFNYLISIYLIAIFILYLLQFYKTHDLNNKLSKNKYDVKYISILNNITFGLIFIYGFLNIELVIFLYLLLIISSIFLQFLNNKKENQSISKDNKKYAVLGLGAVGTVVAGFLSISGKDVTLIGKKEQVKKIKEKGIKILIEKRKIKSLKFKISSDINLLNDIDVIFVCVKTIDTEKVAANLKDLMNKKTIIISLQNGLRNKSIFTKYLKNKVLRSVIVFNSLYLEPGKVKVTLPGGLLLEKDKDHDSADLCENMTQIGLNTKVVNNIEGYLWSKTILNLQNAVTALTGQTIKESFSDNNSKRIIIKILEEGIEIIRKSNIKKEKISEFDPERLIKTLKILNPFLFKIAFSLKNYDKEAKNSMQQSLQRNKKTEIDFINGEIVRLAKKNNLKAPLNQKIVNLIKIREKEDNPQNIDPNKLLKILMN